MSLLKTLLFLMLLRVSLGIDCLKPSDPNHVIILDADAPIELNSPGYPDKYINHADCVWVIKVPSTNGSIIVDVKLLHTENFYDFLRVGVGHNLTGESTVNKMSGHQAPEKMIFKGETEVWFNFVSDGSYTLQGFSLEVTWQGVNETCAGFECESGRVCLADNLVCNGYPNCIDRTDESQCEFCGKRKIILQVGAEPVSISSPNYPDEYPNMLQCDWIISSLIPNGSIEVSFVDFRTELYTDNITIGYGSVINQNLMIEFGGLYPPSTLRLPQGEPAWIQFISEGWSTYSGFLLELHLHTSEDPPCEEDIFMCHTGQVCLDDHLVCDGTVLCLDESDEHQCDICGPDNILVSPNKIYNLTTPLYPRNYPDYLDCKWVVSAFQNGYIVLTILAVDTEHNYDILSIGKGNDVTEDSTISRMSGSSFPNSISVEGAMWIRFTSDKRFGGSGVFMTIEWRSTLGLCHSNEFKCLSSEVCLDAKLKCDGVNHCLDNSDEHGCDICGSRYIYLLPGRTVNIASPLFPQPYPPFLNCKWIITSAGSIKLEFAVFDLHKGFDFLYIKTESDDGDSSLPMTGSLKEVPKSIIIYESSVMMEFLSENSWAANRFLIHISSSDIEVECNPGEISCNSGSSLFCLREENKCDGRAICPDRTDEENCGACGVRNIILENGDGHNLTSSNYPNKYPTNLICSYVIESVQDNQLIVDIIDLDLERDYDFVTLGNGDDWSDSNTIITLLTGVTKITRLVSSGSKMWLRFNSDRTGAKRGFNIRFRENYNSDSDLCNPIDIDCENNICVDVRARCNGFDDCLNFAEEQNCEHIECPNSYQCEVSNDLSEIPRCVAMESVCDGSQDCIMTDDETHCDIKRCPSNCQCEYMNASVSLQVVCKDGWNQETLNDIAKTTHTLKLSDTRNTSKALKAGMFKGFAALQTLSLVDNDISEIEADTFVGLSNLTWLFLGDVPLQSIHPMAFRGLDEVETMVLLPSNQTLDIKDGTFNELTSLDTLYVDDHRLCCHFSQQINCITLEPQPPLFMCGSLMHNSLLRVFMWILGISALFGNLAVAIWRYQEKTKSETYAIQSFIIGNLALSDFLMGIYMVMIASADAHFGEQYFLHSDNWRSSVACKFAGFLSLLSSEASVFFITLICIDRLICFERPLSRLGLSKIKYIVAGIWFSAILLGIIPIIFAGPTSDIYDLSDVCIGLPLITRPSSYQVLQSEIGNPLSSQTFALPIQNGAKPAWYYSIALFLVLNSICFLIVFVCYIKIFLTIKQNWKVSLITQKRKTDVKIALQMAAVVVTDFCCWVPVILLGILSQTGTVIIPLQMYIWAAVFIIPINSSLNPYLYTISSVICAKKRAITSSSDKSTIYLKLESNSKLEK